MGSPWDFLGLGILGIRFFPLEKVTSNKEVFSSFNKQMIFLLVLPFLTIALFSVSKVGLL
jgi:hypothetical protein